MNPTSPETEAGCFWQSGHHLCPNASLKNGWAPFIAPPPQKPAWHGPLWRRRHRANSYAPWTSGQPQGIQQMDRGPVQPGSHLGSGRRGSSQVALLPGIPQGTQLVLAQLWFLGGHSPGGGFLLGMVGTVSSSTQARAGVGVEGGEFFLHSMEKKVEGSTD